jgi:hypothetical protein
MVLSGAFGAAGGTIFATGPGRAVRDQLVPEAGRYKFFFSGSFGRPVNVIVDGRHVGTAAYQVSYPSEWIMIGSAYLSKGMHKIEITRGGFSLHAGNGDGIDQFNRTIGPLALFANRPATPTVHYAAAGALDRLCKSSQRLRWLEVVRRA